MDFSSTIQLDDGFQFGLGAFETIAVEHGQPVFPEKHLARLDRAAAFLQLSSCKARNVTPEQIRAYIAAHSASHHSVLKILLTKENLLFRTRPNPYTPNSYETGFRMDFSPVLRNETSPLVAHKTLNYGDCILEKRAATALGLNERIFLNTKGQLCEGTTPNLVLVRGGAILTPALSCGLLPGILREYLLETYKITETILYPKDLADCEECFVTNSLMGIMPVTQLGEKVFSQRGTADRLRAEYQKHILAYVEKSFHKL